MSKQDETKPKKEKDTKPAKDKPDWERIGAEYRAGVKSIREIARAHGISETAIRKRAKKEGWKRDLTNEVRQRSKQSLTERTAAEHHQKKSKAAKKAPGKKKAAKKGGKKAGKDEEQAEEGEGSQQGSQSGSQSEVRTDPIKPIQTLSDEEIVEEAAEVQVAVVQTHRRAINDSREIVSLMLQELKEQTINAESLREAVEQYLTERKLSGQVAHQIRNAIQLPTRASTLRNMAFTLEKLVKLERQAFNIEDEGRSTTDEIEEILDATDEGTRGLGGYGEEEEDAG